MPRHKATYLLIIQTLIITCAIAGCTLPSPESEYVTMDDGISLAVDVWLPTDVPETGVPTILRIGRYWRDYDLPELFPDVIGKYPGYADWLNAAGFAVVTVDVRGTGASFGTSLTPWSPREVADYPQIVDWILQQPWSNGQIGALGVSYEGVTTEWLGASNHPAVEAILPTYSYNDIYLDVSHPGGVFNDRFMRAWGDVTAYLDQNDLSFVDVIAAADPTSLMAQFRDPIMLALGGVEPVDGEPLDPALVDHEGNTHVYEASRGVDFRDDLFSNVSTDAVSPLLGADTHKRSAAIRRVVGWLDQGTVRGALSAFNTLDADYHVVVIAPETHGAKFPVDPYSLLQPQSLAMDQVIAETWQAVPFLYAFLVADTPPEPTRMVVYYTYVAHRWQQTTVWPPEGFTMHRLYFGPSHSLAPDAPVDPSAEDEYIVDFDATSGKQNRWFDAIGGSVVYSDRARQGERLLVYESDPFTDDLELTGHPVISIKVASTHADGAFIAYLEDVSPLGRVVYLTEGQLRAVHRRVSDEPPPTAVFGPYHTFEREDALPMVPGDVAEISFDLQPISTVIRKGHRLRVALAGHDNGTFQRYPAQGTPTWRVQRNATHASWIDVPLKPHRWEPRESVPPPTIEPLARAICPAVGIMLTLAPVIGLFWPRRRCGSPL